MFVSMRRGDREGGKRPEGRRMTAGVEGVNMTDAGSAFQGVLGLPFSRSEEAWLDNRREAQAGI
jgi:hypothetical protein